MPYKNQKELDAAIKAALEKCVSYLSDKILDCLQKHIMDDVYNFDQNKNTWYVPTFDFKNAFKFEGVKSKINEVSNKLFYDWQSMRLGNWHHGNKDGSVDRRERLAEILNVSGINGDYDFRGKERNQFWDNAIKEIDENFDTWAREAYNLYLK